MSKQNNQRSDSKNPNNPAYKASQDNKSNQLNPNHSETKIRENLESANSKETKTSNKQN